MNRNIINEELNRIRLMMSYNSKKTLTENYNSVDKLELKEFGGKAAIETIFKDLAKVEGNAVKGALETMIKDGKGIKMRVGNGKAFISTDVEQILKAMKGEGGVILKDGAMDLSRQFMKQPELRKNAAEGIAAMDSFAQKFGNQEKEFIMKDLMRGPGKYSKEEAELIADAYVKNRTLPGEVIKSTETTVGTGVKDAKGVETGVEGTKYVKDANGNLVKVDVGASSTGIGKGTGTGTGTGGQATGGNINQYQTFNIGGAKQEVEQIAKAEADAIIKNPKKYGYTKQGKLDKRTKIYKEAKIEIENNVKVVNDLKALAETSPNGFKAWMAKKGILQWLGRWTIGNKWFWLFGAGALGYYWWKNWANNNDIIVDPDDDDEDDDNEQKGGGDTDWENDPDSSDGDEGDPLIGKYKNCSDKFKTGCMTRVTYPLIQILQRSVGLKPTGYWGIKTNKAFNEKFGADARTEINGAGLSDSEIRELLMLSPTGSLPGLM